MLLVATDWARIAGNITNIFTIYSYVELDHETTHIKKRPAKIFGGEREFVTFLYPAY